MPTKTAPSADVLVPGTAQAGHLREHHSNGMTVTASPGAQSVTCGPTSTMRPDICVTDDRWSGHTMVHRSVQDVQVRAADTGVCNSDLGLTSTGRHRAHLGNVDGPVPEIPRRDRPSHREDASLDQTSPSGNRYASRVLASISVLNPGIVGAT